MERDFLGLSSKETLTMVKEEVIKDIGIQFPFSDKGTAVSSKNHIMGSSGFLSINSTPDSNEFSLKRPAVDFQKSFNHDRKGGDRFSLKAYPLQNDVQSAHNLRDVKMFPVSNQAISISVNNSFFNNHLPTHGSNTLKRQLFGRIPGSIGTVAKPVLKSSGSPAQLTIFYGGTVNVYHDITPEKAKAIMLSACKGVARPKLEIQQAVHDSISAIQPPCSGQPSPSGSGSTITDKSLIAKCPQVVATAAPINKIEAPKLVGPVTAKALMPSAVPQARKASLAQFLERRRERVTSAAPYNLSLKPSESTA